MARPYLGRGGALVLLDILDPLERILMVSPLCLSVQLLYHFKNYLYYFDQFGVTCNVNCFFDLGYFFCLDLSRVAPPAE